MDHWCYVFLDLFNRIYKWTHGSIFLGNFISLRDVGIFKFSSFFCITFVKLHFSKNLFISWKSPYVKFSQWSPINLLLSIGLFANINYSFQILDGKCYYLLKNSEDIKIKPSFCLCPSIFEKIFIKLVA